MNSASIDPTADDEFFAGPPANDDSREASAARMSATYERNAEAAAEETAASRAPSRRLFDIIAASLLRVGRRCDGTEIPIPLPWPILLPHFGGGLWPGLHILNSGTGVGKTQWALQVAAHAAKLGFAILYIGLELGDLDLALRMIGGEAHVPWSDLWTGKAGPEYVRRAREAAPALHDLPFFFEVARPQGMSVHELRAIVDTFRDHHPEPSGPGSRPLLVIVDFLQIIGDDPSDEQELRIRIGRASYAMRDFANRLNVAVLAISSIARERYSLLTDLHVQAKLAWDVDENGCPVNRRVTNPDAAVGIGKESGELEYSADSVSILAKVPDTWDAQGVDVVFATMKGRATGPSWSPLHFSGWTYTECPDRGGRVLQAWEEADERRATKREERKTAREERKETAKQVKRTSDAEAVLRFVADHPGCNVREARLHAVSDSSARWGAAVAILGSRLVQTPGKGKSVYLSVHGIAQ
jgi:hypothetical protein